jgi:Leucine-rich repeat (LRR) protein
VRLLILIIAFCSAMPCLSQVELLDSLTLATYQEFTDLKVALENPDRVIKLSLRKKKLREFPKDILRFKNLQYLDLSKNRIKELDDSIVELRNLQYLIVSSTGLERLPRDIGRMKNLRHLNVNQNEISMLPYSFGYLENLEVADLWSNNLDVFPETLVNLKNLKVMDLRNILIPQEHQDRIQEMMPRALIHFSPPCNCSW